MALDPNAMADFVITEMRKEGSSSPIIFELMGHAMAQYLCDNTEVLFSWSGVLPSNPYPPDPVVSYITTDVQGDFSFTHSLTNDPVSAAAHLAEQFRQQCGSFTVGPDAAWMVPLTTFNKHSPPVLIPTGSNDQLISMRLLCTWILTMYKTYINPTPLLGSHGAFLAPPGVGAVMQSIY